MARKFAVLLIAGVAPLFGTALLQMSLNQMTAASTEIVQGTITGSYTAVSGKTIFTHYTVQVAQRWKGPANPVTDVAIPGGSFKSMRQSFAGVPVLQMGQRYMLFLWQGAAGPNQPVGLNQGIFEVEPGGQESAMAFRPAAGEMMLNSAHKPVIDHPVRMRLSDMQSRITAAIAGKAGK